VTSRDITVMMTLATLKGFLPLCGLCIMYSLYFSSQFKITENQFTLIFLLCGLVQFVHCIVNKLAQ
jgi:hypothetical protein